MLGKATTAVCLHMDRLVLESLTPWSAMAPTKYFNCYLGNSTDFMLINFHENFKKLRSEQRV